jgi:hypothetical protein
MADAAALRKQVRTAIDRARQAAATRRARTAETEAAWEVFLANVAVPASRQLANVLRAEGLLFDVQTPSAAVHLVSDRRRTDRIELELDGSTDPPTPMLIVHRNRGGQSLRAERPLAEGEPLGAISEDRLLAALLESLTPWLE